MCQKIPYATRADALDHVKYIATQRRHFSKKLGGAKACRFCGAWHLTTLKK